MKPENEKYLEDNYGHWQTLRDAFYMRGLDGNTRSNFMRIMGEEFSPGYTTDLWCPTCVADMVRRLYQRFDQYKASKTLPEVITEDPLVVHTGFPKNDPPPAVEPAPETRTKRHYNRRR